MKLVLALVQHQDPADGRCDAQSTGRSPTRRWSWALCPILRP